MLRAKGFAIGLVVGIGVTLAITAPWKVTVAQGDRIYTKPGDVDGDGALTIGDAIYLLNHIFASGPEPAVCPSGERVAVFATGQTKCYGDSGREVPCDNPDFPGQDAFYQAGANYSYTDNGDGTVTDNATGLMWAKAPADSKMSWQEALKYCERLTLASHTDWRLPNIRELHSLMRYDRAEPTPCIDPVFASPVSDDSGDWSYWSSSSHVGDPRYAWYVYFGWGYVDFSDETLAYRVRAVRGPVK